MAPTISDHTDLTVVVRLNGSSKKKYKIDIPKEEEEKQNKFQKTFSDLMKKTKLFDSKKEEDILDDMNSFDVFGLAIDLMQNTILNYKTAGYSSDIVIEIPNDACGFYEFNRAYELIELGRVISKEELQKVRE